MALSSMQPVQPLLSASFAPQWCERLAPLSPQAMWISSTDPKQAQAAFARLPIQRQKQIQILAFEQGLLAFAGFSSPELLPWIDQVLWLGRDENAPELLLPTRLQFDIPLPLVQQACLNQTGSPTALIPALPDANPPTGGIHTAAVWLLPLRAWPPLPLWLGQQTQPQNMTHKTTAAPENQEESE